MDEVMASLVTKRSHQPPAVLMVGAGAMAAFVGSRLARSGCATWWLGRHGLQSIVLVIEDGVISHEIRRPAPTQVDLSNVRLAIIAVKAYDLANAWESAKVILSPQIPIWIIGNGAVWEESYLLDTKRCVRLGISSVGVSNIGDCHFTVHGTAGRILIGPLAGDRELSEAETFVFENSAGFSWSSDLMPFAREKWFFNAVINTLAAHHRLARNGDLTQHVDEVNSLAQEVWNCGQARWGSWNSEFPVMLQKLWQLIQDTADNENSMARDRRLGRRLEAPWLHGVCSEKISGLEQYRHLLLLPLM